MFAFANCELTKLRGHRLALSDQKIETHQRDTFRTFLHSCSIKGTRSHQHLQNISCPGPPDNKCRRRFVKWNWRKKKLDSAIFQNSNQDISYNLFSCGTPLFIVRDINSAGQSTTRLDIALPPSRAAVAAVPAQPPPPRLPPLPRVGLCTISSEHNEGNGPVAPISGSSAPPPI